MVDQITGTDAQTGDTINSAVGFTGGDGRSECEITDVRSGEAYIDSMDHEDGIWIASNRVPRRDDFTLEVL